MAINTISAAVASSISCYFILPTTTRSLATSLPLIHSGSIPTARTISGRLFIIANLYTLVEKAIASLRVYSYLAKGSASATTSILVVASQCVKCPMDTAHNNVHVCNTNWTNISLIRSTKLRNMGVVVVYFYDSLFYPIKWVSHCMNVCWLLHIRSYS
jgi:hypothetical protein